MVVMLCGHKLAVTQAREGQVSYNNSGHDSRCCRPADHAHALAIVSTPTNSSSPTAAESQKNFLKFYL